MEATEHKIRKALGISSDTYSEMMYEYGCAYLADRKRNLIKDSGCKEDQAEKHMNIFLYSRIWWNWWHREWRVVDRLFLRLQNHTLKDYKTMQSERFKAPSEKEMNLMLDNYFITKDLSKVALVLTDKQMPYNDDTKNILHTGRNKKILPIQWL